MLEFNFRLERVFKITIYILLIYTVNEIGDRSANYSRQRKRIYYYIDTAASYFAYVALPKKRKEDVCRYAVRKTSHLHVVFLNPGL